MLRNEALEKVESLEGILDGNGRGNALSIARELVKLLKEEDLPEVEPFEVVMTEESRMKNITGPAHMDPDKRKAFIRELSRASYIYRGLEAALEWTTTMFGQEYGTKTEFSSDGERKCVDRQIGYLLFQCTKLLLTNAEMHSDAATVTVSLEKSGKDILVNVEDDGNGFNPNDVAALVKYTKSEEIARIRERVQYVNGNLYVTSKKGAGTRVTIIVPPTVTQ